MSIAIHATSFMHYCAENARDPLQSQTCCAHHFGFQGWVNNCEAGDLIRLLAHYDVTVIRTPYVLVMWCIAKVTHWLVSNTLGKWHIVHNKDGGGNVNTFHYVSGVVLFTCHTNLICRTMVHTKYSDTRDPRLTNQFPVQIWCVEYATKTNIFLPETRYHPNWWYSNTLTNSY